MLKILLGIILTFMAGSIADAQNISPKLGVSPPLFELDAQRGQVLNKKIKIYNPGDVSLPIHARPADFTADEKSGQILFDESANDISFASRLWFKIDNPDFILEPGETEELNFSIKVPENAEPGGHYATLILEPRLPSFYFQEDKPKVIPYVGVLFLISVNVKEAFRPEIPLTLIEFGIPDNFHLKKLENFTAGLLGIFSEAMAAENSRFSIVESGSLSFILLIKNNDIYHVKPSGRLVIYSGKKPVGETEIAKTTILPGKIRQIPAEFKPRLSEKAEKYLPAGISNFISKNLMWGKYAAVLELDASVKESIEFWVFPWKVALIAAIIFAICLFFQIKYRKRIKLAIKILFRGKKKFSTD